MLLCAEAAYAAAFFLFRSGDTSEVRSTFFEVKRLPHVRSYQAEHSSPHSMLSVAQLCSAVFLSERERPSTLQMALIGIRHGHEEVFGLLSCKQVCLYCSHGLYSLSSLAGLQGIRYINASDGADWDSPWTRRGFWSVEL
jgi:hypothetical protein